MNQDDVIRLAEKAGIEEAFDLRYGQVLVRFKDGSLEAFAKLVAEHERSECAKVCDLLEAEVDKYPAACAAAIRARVKV